MELLDDQGQIFGVVNIVDALVVLFVLAVAVAGAALLSGGAGISPSTPESEQTGYATVEYTIPISPSASIPQSADNLTPTDGGDNLTVEETVYSFTRDGQIHTVASVSYPGEPNVGGSVATAGAQADMTTGSTAQSVQFLAVNHSSPSLDVQTRSVVLAVGANESVGHTLEPGMTATVNNQTVATIESITSNPTGPPSRTELVGVELQVWHDGFTNWFGGQAVRVNNRLTIVTDDAVVAGQIYRIGSTDTQALTAR